MRSRTRTRRRAPRAGFVAIAATVAVVAACTSTRATAPEPPSGPAAATIQLTELAPGEQVLDTRPVGDQRVGWALTDRRILRTTDDGDTWTEVVGPWGRTPTIAAFASPNDALVVEATTDGRVIVHRTTDTGRTFATTALAAATGSTPRWLDVADPRHATLVIGPATTVPAPLDIAIPHRTLTTDDGGATWTDLAATGAVDRAWTAADGTGYATGTGANPGLYRIAGRTRPGQRLSPPGDDESGPGGGPVYRVVVHRGSHVVVESHLANGTDGTYRLLVSDDTGLTWRAIDDLTLRYFGTESSTGELGESRLITASQSVDIGILTRTTDENGRTSNTHPIGSCASRIQLRTAPPHRVWIFGDLSACEGGARDGATRIARTTDRGATWTLSQPKAVHSKPR